MVSEKDVRRNGQYRDGNVVLYFGKLVTNPLEIMERSRVLVGVNENIPIVWGLKENMNTEIVVSISAQ
jgi:hypothetical protein